VINAFYVNFIFCFQEPQQTHQNERQISYHVGQTNWVNLLS